MKIVKGYLDFLNEDAPTPATPAPGVETKYQKAKEIKSILDKKQLKGIFIDVNENNPQDHLFKEQINYVISISKMAVGLMMYMYMKNEGTNKDILTEIQKTYGGDIGNYSQGKVIGLTGMKAE